MGRCVTSGRQTPYLQLGARPDNLAMLFAMRGPTGTILGTVELHGRRFDIMKTVFSSGRVALVLERDGVLYSRLAVNLPQVESGTTSSSRAPSRRTPSCGNRCWTPVSSRTPGAAKSRTPSSSSCGSSRLACSSDRAQNQPALPASPLLT